MSTITTKKFMDAMWEFWTPPDMTAPPCGNCFTRPAVALHHIEPRSLAPHKVRDPWNVIPICNECHERAEMYGDTIQARLRRKVIERAHRIGEWNGGNRTLWENE